MIIFDLFSKVYSKVSHSKTDENVNINLTGDFCMNFVQVLVEPPPKPFLALVKLSLQVEVTEAQGRQRLEVLLGQSFKPSWRVVRGLGESSRQVLD